MKEIDLNTWSRKDIFEMFSKISLPFYSVTIPIDVTRLKMVSKQRNLSFYYLMVWACTKAINSVDAFNMRIKNDKVYQLNQTYPSFTTMKNGADNFIIVTTPWKENPQDFCEMATQMVENQTKFLDTDKETEELIYISCTPWFDFTALTNERNIDKDDAIPRLVWGKYFAEGESLKLHLSVDVNHRTIDGYHIGLFVESLNEIIARME